MMKGLNMTMPNRKTPKQKPTINITKVKSGINVDLPAGRTADTDVNDILFDMPTENDSDSGRFGRLVHEKLAEILPMQSGAGPDVEEAGLEVKSRQIHSTAAHTQCSMGTQDIIDTLYEESLLHDKLQKQLKVKINSDIGVITEERVYDFSGKEIQDQVKDGYEACRSRVAAGETGTIADGWVQMEKLPSDSFKVRITNAGMKAMENIAQRDHNAWDAIFPANYVTGGTTDLGSVAW